MSKTFIGPKLRQLRIEAAALNASVGVWQETLNASNGSTREAESQLANAKADAAGTEAAIALLETDLADLRTSVSSSAANAASALAEKRRLQAQVDALERLVKETEVTLYATKMAAAEMAPNFKIAARAVPPEEKSAPRRTLIVLVAVFLAALAAPVHFFGMHALRRYASTLEQEESPAR